MNTPSTDLVLASRWVSAANRRREALRAAHQQDAQALCELSFTWLKLKGSRKARVSPLTLKAYESSIRRFLSFTGPADSPQFALNQLDEGVLELWLMQLQAEGLSDASLSRALSGARTLMRALVWAEVLETDPSAQLRPPRERSGAGGKKSPASAKQLKEVLGEPSQRWPDDPVRARRDALLLSLGGVLGLRAAELVGLDVSDIVGHQLRVRGKGGKQRLLPLPEQLADDLKRYLPVRRAQRAEWGLNADGPLLICLSQRARGRRLTTDGARLIAQGYFDACGWSETQRGLHTLRRTAGTQLYRQTRDLHVVSDILGHSSVQTSAIYARMDDQIRAQALESLDQALRGHQSDEPSHQSDRRAERPNNESEASA